MHKDNGRGPKENTNIASPIYTPEEIAAQAILSTMLEKFAQRLLPAVLKDTHRNGRLVAEYVQEQNLRQSPENFYLAAKSLYRTLDWAVPPAKLVLERESEKGAKTQSQQDAIQPFLEAKKKGEEADAKAKVDEASIKECKALIASYAPTRTTSRGEAINYAKQASVQTFLTKALDNAIEKKTDLQEFTKAVAAEIQRLYSLEEKGRERV